MPLMSNVRHQMSSVARFAVQAITWYQLRVSPRKGFRCAYGARWGHGTCSSIVKSAFASHGIFFGSYTVLAQAAKCTVAAVSLSQAQPAGEEPPAKEDTKDSCS